MIVFWRVYRQGHMGESYSAHDWRCYKGSARLRNGRMHIYPCNGQRRKLSDFIAFDDRKSQPPTIVTSNFQLGGCAELLANVGEVAAHLPPLYIDAHGNIRRTDSTLTLVLMGPDWNDVKEDEFQTALSLPF